MDYLKHYNLLMERSRDRNLDEYTESHHIIPKCMGGTDEQDNLVNLTPEEHYLAHQLLVKIYPENLRLSHAANMMCVNRTTNKLYGWLRRRLSESMRINNPNKGGYSRRDYNSKNGSPNKGYKHTDDTKRVLSDLKRGNKNPNKDGKARLTKTKLIHVETGVELMYNSLKEAEQLHNANHASVYNSRKLGKPYKGYYWYVGKEII